MFIQQTICLICCVQHNSHITTFVRSGMWSHSISLVELFCEPRVVGGALGIWSLISCEIARKARECILRHRQFMFIILLMRTKLKLLQKTLLPPHPWIVADLTGDWWDFHCHFRASGCEITLCQDTSWYRIWGYKESELQLLFPCCLKMGCLMTEVCSWTCESQGRDFSVSVCAVK